MEMDLRCDKYFCAGCMERIKKHHAVIRSLFAVLLLWATVCLVREQNDRGVAAEYQELSRVHLIVASDLHYLSPSLTDYGTYFMELISHSDGKVMRYSDELMDVFVSAVIKQKPDALVLTGDLTFNGARKSHEDLTAKLAKIEEAGIPVLVLSGNHDLNNRNAACFSGDGFERVESVSSAGFEELYGAFGLEDSYSRDRASSSYIWELACGLRLLMLDVNGVEEPGKVPEETMRWMETQLKDARENGCQVIAFSHQNLLRHSMFETGYVIENSGEVLQLFREYGVAANFTGHLHIQHIEEEDGFYEAATSALSVSPNQYADIVIDQAELLYRTCSVPVSAWAKENGCTIKELLDFDVYAKEFFMDTMYGQAVEKLHDLADDVKKDNMARYLAQLNYAYFSGHLEQAEWDVDLMGMWQEQDPLFGIYLDSIIGEADENQNILKLNLDGR